MQKCLNWAETDSRYVVAINPDLANMLGVTYFDSLRVFCFAYSGFQISIFLGPRFPDQTWAGLGQLQSQAVSAQVTCAALQHEHESQMRAAFSQCIQEQNPSARRSLPASKIPLTRKAVLPLPRKVQTAHACIQLPKFGTAAFFAGFCSHVGGLIINWSYR